MCADFDMSMACLLKHYFKGNKYDSIKMKEKKYAPNMLQTKIKGKQLGKNLFWGHEKQAYFQGGKCHKSIGINIQYNISNLDKEKM